MFHRRLHGGLFSGRARRPLRNFDRFFGQVVSADEVITCWPPALAATSPADRRLPSDTPATCCGPRR
jgi:hypothetical protein